VYELNARAVARTFGRPASRVAWWAVGANVWYLGATSLLTDVSSEMVASILPVYLVMSLHLSPVAFGVVDGVYQGASALVRPLGGFLADRAQAYKPVALAGYVLSAACRLGLLAAGGSWPPIAGVILADRLGKGVRTAPRDALIANSAPPQQFGAAFGLHRALDAVGAMLGPIVAFAVLARLPGRFDLVFIVSFWTAVVGVAVLALLVDGTRPGSGPAPSATVTPSSALALFNGRQFRALFVVASVLALGTVSDAFVYLTAQASGRVSAAAFPLFFVATPFCYFLLAGPLGAVADRVGPVRTFLAGHVLLLALYGALLQSSMSRFAPFAAVVLLGAYYAATDGVLAAAASEALPAELRGTGLALLATGTSSARLLASLSFGLVWTWWGSDAGLRVFATTLTAGLVLSMWYLRTLPSPRVSHD
jgi:MFS family permease